jgi:hypothetical protein
MIYTVVSEIGMDVFVVEERIVSQWRLQRGRMGPTIPADMAAPSPDERFHHCIYYRMINEFDRGGPMWEDKPRTRCFFAPMNSM